MPITAASNEANRIASLAGLEGRAGEGEAATKSDIVKPMPASQPAP